MNRFFRHVCSMVILALLVLFSIHSTQAQSLDTEESMVKTENEAVFNKIKGLTIMQKNSLSKINREYVAEFRDYSQKKTKSDLPLPKQLKLLAEKRENEAKKVLTDTQFSTYLILMQEKKMQRSVNR